MTIWDFITLGAMTVIVVAVVFIVVKLGDLPGRIARARNHPYSDAVHICSWIGVVTMGLLWPVALVWAYVTPPPAASGSKKDEEMGGDAQ